MRDRDTKKYLLLFFMIGFTIGIILINTFGKEQILSYGIFNKYWLQQFLDASIKPGDYMRYLVKMRLGPFLLLGIFRMSNIRKEAVFVFTTWTGMLAGLLITLGFIQFGIQGFLLCLLGIMPHFLCYVAVYIIILGYIYDYPESRWNAVKTIFVILVMCIGIISEVYINPIIMRLFIRTL